MKTILCLLRIIFQKCFSIEVYDNIIIIFKVIKNSKHDNLFCFHSSTSYQPDLFKAFSQSKLLIIINWNEFPKYKKFIPPLNDYIDREKKNQTF